MKRSGLIAAAVAVLALPSLGRSEELTLRCDPITRGITVAILAVDISNNTVHWREGPGDGWWKDNRTLTFTNYDFLTERPGDAGAQGSVPPTPVATD
jgi:hypothetical protein